MVLNTLTFTLTLPEGGTFEDQIDGLRYARDAQHRLGNPGVAQSLTIILALAERGKLAFDTDTKPPRWERQQHGIC